MRITAEAKTVTRQRIIDATTNLFKSDGWRNTTTRGIAAARVAEALKRASEEFPGSESEESSLDADLFTLVWSGRCNRRECGRPFPIVPVGRDGRDRSCGVPGFPVYSLVPPPD